MFCNSCILSDNGRWVRFRTVMSSWHKPDNETSLKESIVLISQHPSVYFEEFLTLHKLEGYPLLAESYYTSTHRDAEEYASRRKKLFASLALQPNAGYGLLVSRFRDHTQRRATIGRTSLDEWSARRRDLYLTTHNRKTSMPPLGFEPTIAVGERP
jgi:hypothetical protein